MLSCPLSDFVVSETRPGGSIQSDEEILDAYRNLGQRGRHGACACNMGAANDAKAILDPSLRVRGLSGLRVMDLSIVPTLTSGNNNGPMMAMAWRAAEMIQRAAAA